MLRKGEEERGRQGEGPSGGADPLPLRSSIPSAHPLLASPPRPLLLFPSAPPLLCSSLRPFALSPLLVTSRARCILFALTLRPI